MECGILMLKGGDVTPKIHSTGVPSIGEASAVSLQFFDHSSALLCYRKAVSSKATCIVVASVVGSSKECYYDLTSYQCPPQTCTDGAWNDQVQCISDALAFA